MTYMYVYILYTYNYIYIYISYVYMDISPNDISGHKNQTHLNFGGYDPQ